MVTGSTPILAAFDVAATVQYYKEVLGFPNGWLMDPPTFGGVSWGSINLMFNQLPEVAKGVEGHQHWIDVEDIDTLHAMHQEKGAEILSPPEDKPWGRREYTVRDINGYHLRFAGMLSHVSKGSGILPKGIQIVKRKPTQAELDHVAIAAFGSPEASPSGILERTWGGVVALDSNGEAVGVLRIMLDAKGWFSIWDVAVLPDLQGQRIGSAMMKAALEIVREASPAAFVYLFTFKGEFYERLGFEKGTHHVFKV